MTQRTLTESVANFENHNKENKIFVGLAKFSFSVLSKTKRKEKEVQEKLQKKVL